MESTPELPATHMQSTRRPEIVAVAAVGIAISSIAVILRFYARYQAHSAARISVRFWWDDWALLVTLLFSHGFLALNIAWTNYGLGKHILAVPFSHCNQPFSFFYAGGHL